MTTPLVWVICYLLPDSHFSLYRHRQHERQNRADSWVVLCAGRLAWKYAACTSSRCYDSRILNISGIARHVLAVYPTQFAPWSCLFTPHQSIIGNSNCEITVRAWEAGAEKVYFASGSPLSRTLAYLSIWIL